MPTPSVILNRTKDTAEGCHSFLRNPNQCKTRAIAMKYIQRQLLTAHIEGLDHAIELFKKFTVNSHILAEIIAERAELMELMRAL